MDKQYEVSIQLPRLKPTGLLSSKNGASDSKVAAMSGSKELAQMLAGHESQLQRKLEQAVDIDGFLVDLTDLLENIVSRQEQHQPQSSVESSNLLGGTCRLSTAYWSAVLEELESIGWDRVKPLKNDFSTIQVQIYDKSSRQHEVKVHFPSTFPSTSLRIEPLELPKLSTLDHGAPDVLNTRRGGGAGGSGAARSTAHSGSRLAMELEHCEQITIDPLSPRTFPDLRLFGPESVLEPFKVMMAHSMDMW
ncbi:hypothetical protein DFQ27_008765 [Actinomortierella ambigua]|uniref:Uncharacterized protein n=1 Tax=Actinomortierella ambigua TaxID=1343610 RepID=A0A9P6PPS0_9FUNG|nr:hypothetical protein DFQ27_008765 [Actinomortierella ambigua]